MTKANADEIKGAIHSSFRFIKKKTDTEITGITTKMKTFYTSYLSMENLLFLGEAIHHKKYCD